MSPLLDESDTRLAVSGKSQPLLSFWFPLGLSNFENSFNFQRSSRDAVSSQSDDVSCALSLVAWSLHVLDARVVSS